MEDPKRQKKRMSVVQALRAGIADGSLLDGNYLLPVWALAEATHTSPVTVLRALAVLRTEGLLSGGRKCRPRIASAEHAGAQRVPHPRRSWQVAREHIAHLVLTSHYGEAANLLSAKEFAGRLGMSRRNVRAALESLCDEGIIERCGKRYRPAGPRPSGAFVNRVVLVAPANEHGQVILGFLEEDLLRDLETQCVARSLRLETRGFAVKENGIVFTTARGEPLDLLSDLDGVLGFIQVIFQPEQARVELFKTFFHSRKPVALFDAFGGWEVPAFMKSMPTVRVFDFSTGKYRARMVARYLLSLGHRCIAYLSPYHQLSWSRQRYEGLDETFADGGFPGAVRNFTIGLAGSDGHYEQAQGDYKPHLLERSMSALIESWSRKVPRWYSDAVRERARLVAVTGFHEGEIARRMEECFAAAHAQIHVTAWVGASDDVALLALDYCRRHAIRVPEHLSIIGFDNKVVAFKNGLSSYDFNRHGVISAMLNFLLRPGSISHLTSRQRVQIPGYVVERATTGRPG